MQYNPHVTVRSRGVMEKCTYCIQRINAARIETKLEDLQAVPDGFFQTACQQACPTGAIVFGDIFDYVANDGAGSAVRQAKDDPRTYAMLAYLNIHPRTSYQLRVRNQNWALLDKPPANPFEHHSHGDHHYDEGQDEHDHDEHAIRLPVLSNAGARA
jgi:molybdopterin-containing oxidoreductase family iron-sulfur binding subunit